MSYQNTGYTRKKILTITKGDQRTNYDITASFSENYEALSTLEFGQLSEIDYRERLAAFCAYVYACEEGLQADCPDISLGSTGHNTVLCPLS